jgi:hypothetical protein
MSPGPVRHAAAAGSFYPRDPIELARLVDGLLDRSTARVGYRPRGLIVPHAGYRYSGAVAANAYAALRPWVGPISRVALFGPAHFSPLIGSAVTSADAWLTPLGEVPVDHGLRDLAVAQGAALDDAAHIREHAIEVQLPFLQRLLGERLRVLPVVIGVTDDEAVASLIGSLTSHADLVVVSTDLSHYRDLETADAIDGRTIGAVQDLDPDKIGPEDACGVFPLRGALLEARLNGRRIVLLYRGTSADGGGDVSQVVGYGAFAII